VSEWRLDDNHRSSQEGRLGSGAGLPSRDLESLMEQISIQIAGMSCDGCVNSVRNALTRLPGVQVRQVDVGSATVTYDPGVTSPESVRRAIVSAGFEPQES
jgi:copper chaperone